VESLGDGGAPYADVYPAFDANGMSPRVLDGGFEKLELRRGWHFWATACGASASGLRAAVDRAGGGGASRADVRQVIFTGLSRSMSRDYLEDSLRAMKELTRGGQPSSRFGPFIIRYEKRMLEVLARVSHRS